MTGTDEDDVIRRDSGVVRSIFVKFEAKRDERTDLDRQTAALSQLTGILWRNDRVPPVKERSGSAFGPARNMFESRFFAASESNIKFM
jgi:hypothetical protein